MSSGAAGSCSSGARRPASPAGRLRHGRVRVAGERLSVAADPEPRALDHDRRHERRADDRGDPGAAARPQRRDDARRAARGEQRERERRQRVEPPGHADRLPPGQPVPQQAVGQQPPGAVDLEAQRQDGEHEHRRAQADPQAARIAAPAEAGEREQEDREPREQRLLGDGDAPVAQAARRAAPDEARARRGEEDLRAAGVARDRDRRALGLGMRVQDPHVRPRQAPRDERQQQAAGDASRRASCAGARAAPRAATTRPRSPPTTSRR